MSKDLSRLHKRVQKSFDANFSKPQKIDGIISFIDINEKIFSIRSSNDDYKMDCRTSEDLTKLKIGDEITMKGWLKFYPSTGKMYFIAEYIFVVSEKKKYSTAINTYNKLKDILNNNEYQNTISKITPVKPPKMIYNIGLIVLSDDEENIMNFKISFQEKCVGKLFIYRLKNETLATSLGKAIEYFKKYHDIDLICLLTNNVTGLKSVCDLSSKTNVSYLISRRNVPFIISVSPHKNKNMSEPLNIILSNAKVEGISACTEYIHNIQSSFRKQVEDSIQNGINTLNQLVGKYRKKVFDCKLYINELLDPRFSTICSGIAKPSEKLKDLLNKRLSREIILLYNKKNAIIKHLLEDDRVVHIFQKIIESEEKKLNSLGSLRTQNGFTDTANNGYPVPMPTLPKQQSIAPSVNGNCVEMDPFSKKIENKLVDNMVGDILSINIQRTNGDF
jgi:hypothetical protein